MNGYNWKKNTKNFCGMIEYHTADGITITININLINIITKIIILRKKVKKKRTRKKRKK